MGWSGNLGSTSLSELLEDLARERASGTLRLTRGIQRGRIDFKAGQPTQARAPGVPRLGDLLVSRGLADPITVREAARIQAEERNNRLLGEILIANGVLTRAKLEEAVQIQLAAALSELGSWKSGQFEFDAESQLPPPEPPSSPSEATHPAEEGIRGTTRTRAPRRPGSPPPAAPAPQGRPARLRLEIQSADPQWPAELQERLPVEWFADPNGELETDPPPTPVLLVETPQLRANPKLIEPRTRLVVAVARLSRDFTEGYELGAVAVVPKNAAVASTALSTLAHALALARPEPRLAPAPARKSEKRREPGAGLASLMLDLMASVSQHAERAVLFLLRKDRLLAAGAFGNDQDGTPLAQRVRSLSLTSKEQAEWLATVELGRPRLFSWEKVAVPQSLARLVGKPTSPEAALLPIVGAIGPLGLIYLDNGESESVLGDLDGLGDVAARLGHLLETEFLIDEIVKVLA
ncbi:MAG TPA: DUF4388 domain-containing protein [Thermoanaerobaculia bacterium]|nr:DUF4388 domain-containing protein [Thermoanaerobaculia bacterium]